MKILLNNREEEFMNETLSVTEMLIQKKFSYRMRVVKLNGSIVLKEKYDTTIIRDGDNVQMLYLMRRG
jgi:thiamine biosynthesis protein ThiS